MRLLIPVFSPALGTWGGLTRVLAVAQAAQAAGHQVAFCASGHLEARLREHGHQVFICPPATVLGLPRRLSHRLERRSLQVALPAPPGRDVGNIWMVYIVFGLARAGYLRRLLEAQRQAAAAFRADAVFTDMDPGAFLLGRITGLPLACAYQGVMAAGVGSWQWRLMNRALALVLRAHGHTPCPPQELFYGPHVLKIVPSIPELDGTTPAADVFHAGHLVGELQARQDQLHLVADPTRRYALVYLGSGAIPFTRALRALQQLCAAQPDLTCLVSSQGVGRAESRGNVHVLPYLDMPALLPFASWTICHGGQNTLVESVLHGVPLLVFPGPIFERRFNARAIRDAGAGRMGERDDFTAQWLTTAMQEHHQAQTAATALGQRISAYPGAAGAVRAMADTWELT